MTDACSSEGLNCCLSYPVWGGAFNRSCDFNCSYCEDVPDHIYPAKLSSFAMDAFEVTVGRFRRFVVHYDQKKPGPGDGANPRNPDDHGWQDGWTGSLPGDASQLRDELSSTAHCSDPLWTDDEGANETLPMNCVTWFEAQAFCIFDGGRLPTEAEWNYVAAGGEQQRWFPWSDAHTSDTINDTFAVYQSDESPADQPAPVGSKFKGRGRWLQYDLLGNVAEWVWDGYRQCYVAPLECNDCGYFLTTADTRVMRGGSFINDFLDVGVDARTDAVGLSSFRDVGFRCVRDL